MRHTHPVNCSQRILPCVGQREDGAHSLGYVHAVKPAPGLEPRVSKVVIVPADEEASRAEDQGEVALSTKDKVGDEEVDIVVANVAKGHTAALRGKADKDVEVKDRVPGAKFDPPRCVESCENSKDDCCRQWIRLLFSFGFDIERKALDSP